MKRISYIKCLLIVLSCSMALSSCYDDKSTYATGQINSVVIDTTGISQAIHLGYMEQLNIAPSIYRGSDVKDTTGLTYHWEITETVSSMSDFEPIGNARDLHYVVNREINPADYYTLRLTVTDPENGNLQTMCSWKVYVQSSFMGGLVVSDTKDGSTSDISYIKNGTLTESYTGDEKIYYHLLQNSIGKSYNGLLSTLMYEVMGYTTFASTHVNQLWALTPDGNCVRYNCENFTKNGDLTDESIITYRPSGLKLLKLFKGNTTFFALTNKGIYSLTVVNANIFGWYDAAAKDAQINNNIVAANPSTESTNNYSNVVWLDKTAGQFVSYTGTPQFGASLGTYEASNIFNPNDMSHKTAIAAGISTDTSLATFLLKDDESGEYGIYTLSAYKEAQGFWDENYENWTETSPEQPAIAKGKFSIPAEGKALLDKAVSIFFAQNEWVMYVATSDGIYAITYGSGNSAVVSTVAKYTPAAGEKITKAKLYQQGEFTNDFKCVTGESPFVTPLPWNNKAIVVATQKGEYEGTIYVIPITQLGIGSMDVSKALVYKGFGKILDMTSIGY